MSNQRNVFGESLAACCDAPATGFYRTGCCETGPEDLGLHVICAEMTEAFLAFTKSRGNDLASPVPEIGFQAWSPEIAGACVRPDGGKLLRPAQHRRSCSQQHTTKP